jgi:DNA-binding CsgD family transcriptional regulator/PAS domain-containing protein
MATKKRFSRLVGEIYDSTLDPSLWPDVLGKIAAFVGGQSAGLISRDSVSKSGNAHYTFGCNSHYLQLYLDRYAKLDPTTALFFFAPEQVASVADFMPYDEYLETRFHKEWARPQGWVDWVSAVLEKSATSFAFMSVIRDKTRGRVDDGARRRMRLVVPHARRAVLISKVIDLKSTEATTLADALDGLSAGFFLVDERGRIVHANAAGHAMLAAANFLRASGGRLVANDPQADRLLGDVFLASARGDAEVGTSGISVPLTAHNGERHVAHVLPLTSGARRPAGSTYRASAALFIHKASLETPSPPEVIATTYKLTPTELRVLLAIVEVGGADTAEALGVAETTVKTHLSRLFQKTGASRQAGLVKLVAGFSSPLLG